MDEMYKYLFFSLLQCALFISDTEYGCICALESTLFGHHDHP